MKKTVGVRAELRTGILLCWVCFLSACCDVGRPDLNVSGEGKTLSPRRATTRPYQIKGAWYYPQQHYELDETGVASHYGAGDGTHGLPTATGERFDRYGLTAAHKTAHLPSVALVTNLENGRVLKVKLNDRGPFKNERVLDVSSRAAQLLGFYEKGTALVRVQVLPEESVMLAENQKGWRKLQQDRRLSKAPQPRVVPSARSIPQMIAQAQKKYVQPPVTKQVGKDQIAALIDANPGVSFALSGDPALETQGQRMQAHKGGIYVRVATYSTLDQARAEQRRMPVKGVFVQEKHEEKRAVFHVMVGPLKTVAHADETLDTLIGLRHTQARIVVESIKNVLEK